MSRNALALFDTDSRNQVFQYIKIVIDRKVQKNEMVSPYDDQLIGKMNYSMGSEEKSMFFTYARASEYHGMRFKHHKVVYASMDVSESSSKALQQICSQFGGFFIADDEISDEWIKIEAQPTVEEELLNVVEEENELEMLMDGEEDDYDERESFTIAKEELQRNTRNTKPVRFSDDIESYVHDSGYEDENRQSVEKQKDGDRNGKPRNHYHKNRNRNGGENHEGKSQDGKLSERQDKPQKQESGNHEAADNNGNNNHRRRRHHHHRGNNRPKSDGGQSTPKADA